MKKSLLFALIVLAGLVLVALLLIALPFATVIGVFYILMTPVRLRHQRVMAKEKHLRRTTVVAKNRVLNGKNLPFVDLREL